MNCSKARVLISAELDGELTPREEVALTLHLGKCKACALEKEAVTSLRGVMATWTDEEPSELLAQKFAYKLQDFMAHKPEQVRPERKKFGWAGTAFAGVAAAAVLAVMLLTNHGQVPQNVQQKPTIATQIEQPVKPIEPIQQTPKVENTSNTEIAPVIKHPKPAHKHRPFVAVKSDHTPAKHSITAPHADNVLIAAPGGTSPDISNSSAGNEGRVRDNIGEAGLAMSENVEKLRGKLQEAVDLMVSKPPMPTGTDTDVNEVSNP